jgi:hypothetical protein
MTPQFANPIWGLSALLMTALLTLLSREPARLSVWLIIQAGMNTTKSPCLCVVGRR